MYEINYSVSCQTSFFRDGVFSIQPLQNEFVCTIVLIRSFQTSVGNLKSVALTYGIFKFQPLVKSLLGRDGLAVNFTPVRKDEIID